MVELERAARRVGQRYRAQRLDQLLLVVGLATGFLQRRLGDHAVNVHPRGVKARDVAGVADHALDQFFVARRVEVAGIG